VTVLGARCTLRAAQAGCAPADDPGLGRWRGPRGPRTGLAHGTVLGWSWGWRRP